MISTTLQKSSPSPNTCDIKAKKNNTKWGSATLYSVGQNQGIVDLVKHWLDFGYTSLLHGAKSAVLGKKAAACLSSAGE